MKLLSITVPAYNAGKTIAATLDSLCVDELIDVLDIIVVDDGSKDDTAAIAGGYVQKYPGSVRLISKKNGGHGSAVNAGIAVAEGRFFKVVDSDDRLEHDGFIELAARLQKTRADILAADYQKVSAGGGSEPVPMRFEGVEPGRLYRFDEIDVSGRIYFGIHSMTIRTAILQDNDIRLQENTFYVDTEYGLLPIPYINKIEFLDKFVYLYTVDNPLQSISTRNFVNRYEDHYRVVRRMTEFETSCDAGCAQHEYILSTLKKLCFTNYMLAAFYDDDIKRGRERAREFDRWLKQTDMPLYRAMENSLYVRALRITNFTFLPRGSFVKGSIQKVYKRFKPLFAKKRKLTY